MKTELDYSNFESYIDDTVTQMAAGGTATDNPDLAAFRDHGGKLILWHGYADQLIMPEGTIDYYDEVVNTLGGSIRIRRNSPACSWRRASVIAEIPEPIQGPCRKIRLILS